MMTCEIILLFYLEQTESLSWQLQIE